MRIEAFRQWLSHGDDLTLSQRRRAVEVLHRERQPCDGLAGVLDAAPPARATIADPAGAGVRPTVCRGSAAASVARRSMRSAGRRWRGCGIASVGASMPRHSSTATRCAVRRAAAVCTKTPPSAGATGFSPFRRASSRPACTASSKPTKPTSWTLTTGSATCRALQARPVQRADPGAGRARPQHRHDRRGVAKTRHRCRDRRAGARPRRRCRAVLR